MAAGIRNIIFDMGGVLLDLDRERCIAAFARIGYPDAATLLSNYTQQGIFGELESGLIEPSEFYDFIRSEAGRQLTDGQIMDALNEFVVGLPVYKLQMLLDLRKRFNIYMLSNTSAVMMPDIKTRYFTQQGLTFDDYFDKAFLSYEMGSIKPDPAIFRVMLDRSDIVPEESLFLDDGPANTAAAEKFGFHTYLTKPHEDYRHIFTEL